MHLVDIDNINYFYKFFLNCIVLNLQDLWIPLILMYFGPRVSHCTCQVHPWSLSVLTSLQRQIKSV